MTYIFQRIQLRQEGAQNSKMEVNRRKEWAVLDVTFSLVSRGSASKCSLQWIFLCDQKTKPKWGFLFIFFWKLTFYIKKCLFSCFLSHNIFVLLLALKTFRLHHWVTLTWASSLTMSIAIILLPWTCHSDSKRIAQGCRDVETSDVIPGGTEVVIFSVEECV